MQQRATRLSAIAHAVRRLFTPMKLFALGEQGAWYDPSDFDRYMAPLGPELVVNGTFDTSISGWTVGANLSVVWSAGKAQITRNGLTSPASAFEQNLSTTAGGFYKLMFTFSGTGTGAAFSVLNGTINIIPPTAAGNGIFTYYFSATAATTQVNFWCNDGQTVLLDSVTVRELTALGTATLFQDAAGTTPVTSVEQPVGLMLDKSRGLVLGPELVTNGGFDSGIAGWTAQLGGTPSFVAGELAVTGNGSNLARTSTPITTIAGKTYRFTTQIRIGSVTTGKINFAASNSENLGSALVFLGSVESTSFTVVTGIFVAQASITHIGFSNSLISTGTFFVDNISVRELPGAHAFQTTATSRPVLSARYNQLLKTESFDDGVWFKSNLSVVNNSTIAPYGAFTADTLTANAGSSIQPWVIATNISFTAGLEYKYSCFVKKNTHNFFQIATSSSGSFANFDIANGVAGTFGGGTSEITALDNGWYRVTHTFMASSTTTSGFVLLFISASNSAIRIAPWSPVGNESVYIWGASLVPADQAGLPYQRVNTATDYDAGPAFPRYLKADGIDDGMVTGTITPGTDKAQVFAGVRKLSDAGAGVIAETTTDAVTNAGIVVVSAPIAGGQNQFSWGAGAGAYLEGYRTYTSPDTKVISASLDSNSIPRVATRLNGSVVSASSSTGAGSISNFVDSPLYLFRRGGTSLPFNGNFYGGIIRFGPNLPIETIQQTEAYMAAKTGVTLA